MKDPWKIELKCKMIVVNKMVVVFFLLKLTSFCSIITHISITLRQRTFNQQTVLTKNYSHKDLLAHGLLSLRDHAPPWQQDRNGQFNWIRVSNWWLKITWMYRHCTIVWGVLSPRTDLVQYWRSARKKDFVRIRCKNFLLVSFLLK